MNNILQLEKLIKDKVNNRNTQNELLNILGSIHCNISDLNHKIDDKQDRINDHFVEIQTLRREIETYKRMIKAFINKDEYYD